MKIYINNNKMVISPSSRKNKKNCKSQGKKYIKAYSYIRNGKEIKVKANCVDVKKKSPKTVSPTKKNKKDCKSQGKKYIKAYSYIRNGKEIKVKANCVDIKKKSPTKTKSPVKQIPLLVSTSIRPVSPLSSNFYLSPETPQISTVEEYSKFIQINDIDNDDVIFSIENDDYFNIMTQDEAKKLYEEIGFELSLYILKIRGEELLRSLAYDISDEIDSALYQMSKTWIKPNISNIRTMTDYKNTLYVYMDTLGIIYNLTKRNVAYIDSIKFNILLDIIYPKGIEREAEETEEAEEYEGGQELEEKDVDTLLYEYWKNKADEEYGTLARNEEGDWYVIAPGLEKQKEVLRQILKNNPRKGKLIKTRGYPYRIKFEDGEWYQIPGSENSSEN